MPDLRLVLFAEGKEHTLAQSRKHDTDFRRFSTAKDAIWPEIQLEWHR
ncbi:hypothetical protein Plim_0709 [Planctopirus limnophila DSM 3776]|uniref:Uncharacterized protein n=1 Tax=Planctopirus limnophila (strain ATCC 43296 / DSM 3776 / IFAM 1008 / Mu 290) TaxID=521674 RepID=D5SRM2_PLAL2|nr:hypothetical protein Plim_0709 [Planctopirus limnophila DSM 3776]